MRLGSHMSIAGGTANAFDHGEKAGCEAIQIFLKNNNRWDGKPIDDEDRKAFHRRRGETGIGPVIAHNCYLINLCSPDETVAMRSRAAMLDELQRAEALGVEGVVLHPGSPKGGDQAEAIRVVAEVARGLIKETPRSKVRLLFETTAGAGSTLGATFEQIAELIGLCRKSKRVGVCLDTCHIFAAGYDIRSKAAYEKTMREFDKTVGLEWIAAFHLNDSKGDLGSRKDRHAHIGEGAIGVEGFRWFVNDERFADLPGILETPKDPDLKDDIRNLATLRGLLEKGRRKRMGLPAHDKTMKSV